MNPRILVTTGAESSGKTTLARQLASTQQAPLVLEASRDYLQQAADRQGGHYRYQEADLLAIARLQVEREQQALAARPPLLVCDTDLLVIVIWSQVRFGRCHPWIEDQLLANQAGRHYLLCHWDIPWEADPLRENPNDRGLLFQCYQQVLQDFDLCHSLVQGNPLQRLEQALALLTDDPSLEPDSPAK